MIPQKEKFQFLFEHAPVAMWVEDCSSLVRLAKKLEKKRTASIHAYLLKHPRLILEAFGQVKILEVNKAAFSLWGVNDQGDEGLSRPHYPGR